MKFGLDVPTTGPYADPRLLAQFAADAEASGWDGFFVWDILNSAPPPWVRFRIWERVRGWRGSAGDQGVGGARDGLWPGGPALWEQAAAVVPGVGAVGHAG
jgi:hypothetical protein